MLYTTSPWLVYFITRSLYLIIPPTHFTRSPTPVPSGNHPLFSVSISVFLFSFATFWNVQERWSDITFTDFRKSDFKCSKESYLRGSKGTVSSLV